MHIRPTACRGQPHDRTGRAKLSASERQALYPTSPMGIARLINHTARIALTLTLDHLQHRTPLHPPVCSGHAGIKLVDLADSRMHASAIDVPTTKQVHCQVSANNQKIRFLGSLSIPAMRKGETLSDRMFRRGDLDRLFSGPCRFCIPVIHIHSHSINVLKLSDPSISLRSNLETHINAKTTNKGRTATHSNGSREGSGSGTAAGSG